jgi:LytR cell envelope-related transcriptional attenuator
VTAPGTGRGGRANGPGVPPAVRGAVLVGLAVILGVVGLQILDDSSSGSGAGASGSGDGTATTSLPTTTGPVRAPAQVRVKVYNASGVLGVAQTMTDTLKAQGYNVQTPDTLSDKTAGQSVKCRAGFEREATALAGVIGNGATVQPFPSSPPTGADSADCLVIIGTK